MSHHVDEIFIRFHCLNVHAGHNKYLNTDYTICILVPQTACLVFKYLPQVLMGLKAIKINSVWYIRYWILLENLSLPFKH